MSDELSFEDDGTYPNDDRVPAFDRGKQRDLAVDNTVPVPSKAKHTNLRNCPRCGKLIDLRVTEIGLIDQWGDCIFFCSEEHKNQWNPRKPSTEGSNGKVSKPFDYEQDRDFYGIVDRLDNLDFL